MTRLIKGALAVLFALTASVALAAQVLRTDPDGSVGFNVSTTGVTRVSVVGDRIRRIVNDGSIFEMSNDEETGDVFFRAVGEGTESETGYIVTERGVTIGYTIQPVARSVPPVLITINGQEAPEEEAAAADFGAGVGFSDDVALMMSEIVREVAREHVLGRDVPRGRDGRVVARSSGDGWTASVRIAVAGAEGRLVREQDFYGTGVRAVWIANPHLPAEGRTFVIVVEAN
ncbi:hypothetical protein EU803_14955 [Loktanella sp. IMCC34160]|uniref:TraK domain-containing protein n=1 Tax=Loktanella sp. IMCC34160 TaxID=2510646 RepID=UPI00101D53E7|nr:type-F conjugative transfer system secretin TraK [Loktanella sp. IMCC34160]RYG89920.1 hypothetical protein EU803_14955 [Loktanella sp. IMCC34160]